ncbi:hypothetical protein [uncultured Arcobacter sp.]|nr:hypothetical protein [uncultured Arcobacter sp.]
MENKEIDIERLLRKIQILKEEVGLTHKKIKKGRVLRKPKE